MTKEEAIKGLEYLARNFSGYKPNEEMFSIAIEALKAQDAKPTPSHLPSGDTIYRQAAIDAIEEIPWYHQNKNGEMVHGANSAEDQAWYKADDIYHVLDTLPSTQSEIIHCEDCEHNQKWRSEESAKKFGQVYECARNVLACPKSDDYCSRAERRTDG